MQNQTAEFVSIYKESYLVTLEHKEEKQVSPYIQTKTCLSGVSPD